MNQVTDTPPLPALSDLQILAIVLAVVIVLVALIPASRRCLINAWMQVSGWMDGRLLRKHHGDLVVRAVTRRISGVTLRTESVYAHWLKGRRSWFSWLGVSYNKALAALADARRRIADAKQEGLIIGTGTPLDMPQFLPLGPLTYYLMQFVLGCGDAVLTFLAFQTWHLSPAWLLLVVVLFGVVGAVLGHLCGQAIYRRKNGHAVAIGCICFLYCMLLGSMRFAWLAGHQESGGASLINFLSAFGWPSVCIAVSVVIGSQLRYRTALEQALVDEIAAKNRSDRLNQHGLAAQKTLHDRMRGRKAYMTTLVDAYHRGFSFAWVSDPIVFPEQEISVPEDELAALWPPPTRLESVSTAPVTNRLQAPSNGSTTSPVVSREKK